MGASVLVAMTLCLFPFTVHAGQSAAVVKSTLTSQTTNEQRIYQVDSIGSIQYHKPSWVVEPGGRVIETDSIGNKLYHRPQYRIIATPESRAASNMIKPSEKK